jgi:hypothetical protein
MKKIAEKTIYRILERVGGIIGFFWWWLIEMRNWELKCMIFCEIGLCHIEETTDDYQIFSWVHGNLWW